jgi:hypothetical protein
VTKERDDKLLLLRFLRFLFCTRFLTRKTLMDGLTLLCIRAEPVRFYANRDATDAVSYNGTLWSRHVL